MFVHSYCLFHPTEDESLFKITHRLLYALTHTYQPPNACLLPPITNTHSLIHHARVRLRVSANDCILLQQRVGFDLFSFGWTDLIPGRT